MAKYVEIRRYNGSTFETLYPKTHYSKIDGLPSNFVPTAHTHTISQITDFTSNFPTASATTLGGIKVGSGLSISNGVLSASGGSGGSSSGGVVQDILFSGRTLINSGYTTTENCIQDYTSYKYFVFVFETATNFPVTLVVDTDTFGGWDVAGAYFQSGTIMFLTDGTIMNESGAKCYLIRIYGINWSSEVIESINTQLDSINGETI